MRSRLGAIAYWMVAVALVAFGFSGLLTIGAPFLLTGLALMLAAPWRRTPSVLWAVLVGVWSFVGGYLLATPVRCTTGGFMDKVTVCTYVFGIRYTAFGAHNPSLWPRVVSGAVAVAIGVALCRYLVGRRVRTSASS